MVSHIPFQQKEGFCGPASLKIVLNSFGIKRTEKQLAKKSYCTSSQGATAFDLLETAKKSGLKGFMQDNCNISDIIRYLKRKKKHAIIVEWFLEDDGHFCVVAKIDKENIYLQDPDLGHLRAIRLDIFKRIWFSFEGSFMKEKEDLVLRRLIVFYK
jgi:predicted double-glycine peptidase